MARRVVIFACGEPLRGDDGAARLAVASLPPRARGAAAVHRVSQLEPEVLMALPPGLPVIVIDTVVGIDPGAVSAIDLEDLPDHARQVRPRSTHQLSLDQVIGLAGALGHPVAGVFLGIGGGRFEPGGPLSPEVSAAIPTLRAAIVEHVERLAADPPAGPVDGVPSPAPGSTGTDAGPHARRATGRP
jgi:hydrogenase maturation protease